MSVPTGSRSRAALTARLLLVVLGSVATLVVAAGPAAAHDVLSGTTPANGSTVARVPSSVVLTFDAPAIAMGTKLVVTGPSGEVQQGGPVLVDNTVTQPVQGGAPAGTYTVEWRVTSADGHPVSGTFTFTAEAAGTGRPSPVPATATPVAGTGPAVGAVAVDHRPGHPVVRGGGCGRPGPTGREQLTLSGAVSRRRCPRSTARARRR